MEHIWNMNGRHHLQYALLILLTLLFSTPSLAGVLKIQTQTTVEKLENRLTITVRLTNEGTAIAHNLQVHLKILGETLDSKITPQLDVGGTTTFLFEKDTENVETGRYPLTVFVDFHDSKPVSLFGPFRHDVFHRFRRQSRPRATGKGYHHGQRGETFIRYQKHGG